MLHRVSDLDILFEIVYKKKMRMRSGTWNVRGLYRMHSLITVARELAKCKLNLMGVPEVRWDTDGTEPVGDHTLICGSGNENHEIWTGYIIHRGFI
jgi:hypothetical protein